MRHRMCWILAVVMAGPTFVSPGSGAAQAASAPAGAIEFAGQLLQKHSYLLNADDHEAFDEVNRQLREADHQQRKAKDDDARRESAAKLATATARLLDLLDKSPVVKRISLEDGKVVPSIVGPHAMPGDVGAIIFHIDSGQGETRFVTQDVDQSQRDWGIDVDCAPTGTTWALIGISNLPVKRTSFWLKFKRQGMPSVKTLMDVTAPESGRLKVTVLSADTGKPVPAMVRLVWRTNGVDRKPSTAIEFGPQFDGRGNPSGRRRPNLPGRLGNWWWCVPEPFDMALPPGEYDIAISRGVEHVPVFDRFKIEPGQRHVNVYKPRRWVDMRELGWYSGDDHVHCRITSDDDAERLMAWIQAEDIHVANVVKMGDIYRTWFEQRGWGKEYRVIDRGHVLSPGQECPRTHQQIGHTISMNTKSMIRDTDRYYLYDWVADTVHAQDGLWGYCHINSNMFHVHRDMSINIPKGKCDFAEILQFNRLGTDLYYDFLNAGFRITASAGSDVPWGGTIGEVRMYACIGKRPFSADAWFDAVRQGRTFVTSGPMVEFRVDDALPGDEILVTENRKLRVTARAWGDPERTVPSRLEIIRHGKAIKTVESSDSNHRELSLDFEIDAGRGCWIAARVKGNDGTSAHTTPIYVIRKGLRFWKLDEIDALIAKRLTSLDEIAGIVGDAQRRDKAGEIEGDRTLKQLAAQGPELLKRVEEARRIYSDLKKTAEREREIRNASR